MSTQLIATFWVPVSQIIPVLALALVLEARRQARNWAAIPRGIRLYEGIAMTLTGVLLVWVENLAILSMAEGNPREDWVLFATIAIAAAIALTAASPIGSLLFIALLDITLMTARAAPFSPWRRDTKKLLGIRKDYEEMIASDTDALSKLDDAEKRVDEIHGQWPKARMKAWWTRLSPPKPGESEAEWRERKRTARKWLEDEPTHRAQATAMRNELVEIRDGARTRIESMTERLAEVNELIEKRSKRWTDEDQETLKRMIERESGS